MGRFMIGFIPASGNYLLQLTGGESGMVAGKQETPHEIKIWQHNLAISLP